MCNDAADNRDKFFAVISTFMFLFRATMSSLLIFFVPFPCPQNFGDTNPNNAACTFGGVFTVAGFNGYVGFVIFANFFSMISVWIHIYYSFRREFFVIEYFDENNLLGDDYLECVVGKSTKTTLDYYPEIKEKLLAWNRLTRKLALIVLVILIANFVISAFAIFHIAPPGYTTYTVFATQGLLTLGAIYNAYTIYSSLTLAQSGFKIEPLSYNVIDADHRDQRADEELKRNGAYEFSDELIRIKKELEEHGKK